MAVGMYEIISKKRDARELTRADIEAVISGYVKGDVPDYQMSALLMAIYIRGLSDRELADLTEVMMLSGERIALSDVSGPRIDKHSTGGVGDKVSFVLAPLVASCGREGADVHRAAAWATPAAPWTSSRPSRA